MIEIIAGVFCFLLGLIILISICRDACDGGDVFAAIVCFIVLSLIGAIACGIISCIEVGNYTTNYNYTEIVSLNIRGNSDGMFVLGTGSVNGKEHYYYFKKTKEGLIRDHMETDGIPIIENSEVTPRIEWDERTYDQPWWLGFHNPKALKTYRIVVPAGTVIEKFKLE